eukprot:TRINITY_DN30166_c0_g1_i2.p1 TRINITY_DN30166_c0_g1~~TRINITY_DN30166_c0_g1_i2.p1  ORF type:complete len:154 (+),score=1.82 TRINITY_DN30166_c0_g1_i2:43-504(+)
MLLRPYTTCGLAVPQHHVLRSHVLAWYCPCGKKVRQVNVSTISLQVRAGLFPTLPDMDWPSPVLGLRSIAKVLKLMESTLLLGAAHVVKHTMSMSLIDGDFKTLTVPLLEQDTEKWMGSTTLETANSCSITHVAPTVTGLCRCDEEQSSSRAC